VSSLFGHPVLDHPVRTILLDIEGTTTPIDFVYKVLFPYARSQAEQYLRQHSSLAEIQADIAELRNENSEDARQGLNPPMLRYETQEAELQSLVAYIDWLIARDRKSTPLKSLQGKIWEEGYRSGQLSGEVFEDVPRALRRWQHEKRNTCIFSSGSVLAQELLFANTTSGDLTPYISHYFDTTTGAKSDPESYKRIANVLGQSPRELAFISDVISELDAGHAAGFEAWLCKRPGNHPQPENTYRVIRTLDEFSP
jgi:enolase-phosphatase E1